MATSGLTPDDLNLAAHNFERELMAWLDYHVPRSDLPGDACDEAALRCVARQIARHVEDDEHLPYAIASARDYLQGQVVLMRMGWNAIETGRKANEKTGAVI